MATLVAIVEGAALPFIERCKAILAEALPHDFQKNASQSKNSASHSKV
jgi:hypothetical protein